ncbi:hypothetical protein MIMGU_mgv1a003821mg [Erythranthe guttata]|uniref:Pseudouridine synthase I TruA alpha/beta domain-containing protein n=1 Tax=Erythranthe guttata TaxID=4155 RepID=A0A022PTI0_ERYGU|nr:hypothetical protein MIMGU_mgv1a003821mg [Erythranthe guttata]
MAENSSTRPSEELPDPKRQKMSSSGDDEENRDGAETIPRKPKYKRRKIAIFFAYCGVGYQGMQKNPGAKTIEGDLEEALYLSGAIPEEERGLHKRYEWARSARTDKGVSAVGQVVSGRFYVDPPGFIERLHSHLSPQIRIFGYKRVTPSFNAKKFCDRRRYCLECSERGRKVFGVMGKQRNFESKAPGEGENENVEVGSGISSNNGTGSFESKDVGENVEVGSGILSNNGSPPTDEKVVANSLENNEIGSNGSENVSIGAAQDDKMEVDKAVLVDSAILSDNVSVLDESKTVVDSSEKGIENTDLENGSSETEKLLETGDESIEKRNVDKLESENANGHTEAEKKSEFCYGEEEKARFNRILKFYEGTHNFHNFTTRTKAEDPAARRYILSFNANTVVNVDGIDFVKCEVVGQSFMLHQIRKMIGLAVAMMRNITPESKMETAFLQSVRFNVPMAPEVGLYLDECFFSSYNNKWKDSHEEVSMKAYAEESEEFKMKYIYPHVASSEHKDGAVALWLHSLNYRNFPDLRAADSEPVSDGNGTEIVNNCAGSDLKATETVSIDQ